MLFRVCQSACVLPDGSIEEKVSPPKGTIKDNLIVDPVPCSVVSASRRTIDCVPCSNVSPNRGTAYTVPSSIVTASRILLSLIQDLSR